MIAAVKHLSYIILSFVLMFWNVENFFDPFDNPDKDDNAFTPAGEKHWTWNRFSRKKNSVAKTIVSVADSYGELPAIVGLCEVENKMVLRALVTDSPLAEAADFGFIHRESPDRRGIDVALVYRKDTFVPIKIDSLRVEEFPTRDILYVKGLVRGVEDLDTLHIFVNHWPSKLGGAKRTSDRRREAASLLKNCLDSLMASPGRKDIVIMGDFNDTAPETGVPQIMRLKPEVRGRDSPAGTLRFKGKWEQIDHFFVSEPLLRNQVTETIYPMPFLLEEDKTFLGVKPRRTYIGPRYNGGVSDHLPIILSIGKK